MWSVVFLFLIFYVLNLRLANYFVFMVNNTSECFSIRGNLNLKWTEILAQVELLTGFELKYSFSCVKIEKVTPRQLLIARFSSFWFVKCETFGTTLRIGNTKNLRVKHYWFGPIVRFGAMKKKKELRSSSDSCIMLTTLGFLLDLFFCQKMA